MKILLATVLLWTGMFMSRSEAQVGARIVGDTLNILARDQIYARVITRDIDILYKDSSYLELLASFKTNLKSVQSEIPDYFTSQIIYEKGRSLRVEEISGIKKYRFENDDVLSSFTENIAFLTDGQIHILLYFNSLEELVKQNYSLIIKNAVEKIEAKRSKKKITFQRSRRTFNYSYAKNELIPDKRKIKNKRSFSFITSSTLGLYKDRPVYELSLGLGLYVGARKRSIIFLTANRVLQYNKEQDKMVDAELIEAGFYFPGLSLKLGFPYDKENVLNDIDYRLTVNVYIKKTFSFGIQIYNNLDKGRVFPGLTVGVGI